MTRQEATAMGLRALLLANASARSSPPPVQRCTAHSSEFASELCGHGRLNESRLCSLAQPNRTALFRPTALVIVHWPHMRKEPLHLVTRPKCTLASRGTSVLRKSKAAESRCAESSCQCPRGAQLFGIRSVRK